MTIDPDSAGKERLQVLVEKALQKPEDPSVPPRLSKLSRACGAGGGIAILGGIAAVVIGSSIPSFGGSQVGEVVVASCVFAALIGMVAVGKYIYDLQKPSLSDRRTPASAVNAYFKSLRCWWWRGAAACLSWSAKDGTVVRREGIDALDLDEVALPISDPSGLKLFWAPLMSGGRKLSYRAARATLVAEDRSLVSVELSVKLDLRKTLPGSRARQGGSFIRNANAVRLVGKWCVYRREGLWYVLESGFPDGCRAARVT